MSSLSDLVGQHKVSEDFYNAIPDDRLPVINKMSTCHGITITFEALAWMAVGFRLYCRIKIMKKFGLDDVFVVLALLATMVSIVSLNLQPTGPYGQHFGYVLLRQDWGLLTYYLKLYFMNNLSYIASSALIKMSILLQYLRIYNHESQRVPRYVCYGLVGFVFCWGSVFFFLTLFGCHPVSDAWTLTPTRKCFGMTSSNVDELYAGYLAHSISNMILDYLVLLFPAIFFRYWKSEGSKHKAGLASLFIIGTCVATVSAVRLSYIIKTKAATDPGYDITYNSPPIAILSALEVQCAVICASIPIFWPTLATNLRLNRIIVVREVAVSTEARKPSSRQGWQRHSESSDTELRELAMDDSGASRVYGKDSYVTGWEVDDGDHKGNHATAARASVIPSLPEQMPVKGESWLDMNR